MRLAVNVDHVATLREARRAIEPQPAVAAVLAELAGAEGITVHLRADRRHINERDLALLRQVVRTKLNVEMAATPEMVRLVSQIEPDQVTLVPERPQEVTTEGGLDVVRQLGAVSEAVRRLQEARVRVSIFVDPDAEQVARSRQAGAQAVEINTGPYAASAPAERPDRLAAIADAAMAAAQHELEVLAGHGLTYVNVRPIVGIRQIAELNIGHSIVARATLVGIDRAVRDMVALLRP
jgi:pyridoxine 5-phosphate synthase